MFFSALPIALSAAALLCASCAFAAPTAEKPAPKLVRPQFPAEIPEGMTADGKLVRMLRFHVPAPHDELRMPAEDSAEVTILGEAAATEEQMLARLLARNPQPKLTGTPEELVRIYYEEAAREGIRPDAALAQAYKETGYFAYGGDVDWQQNNFCGLGATGGGVKGLSFPDMRTGARAHIQHLLAYASKQPPTVPIVDPRYDLLRTKRPDVFGRLTRWVELNGVWAVPGRNYGQEILMIRDQARLPDGSDASLHAADAHIAQADNADNRIYRGLVYLHRAAYPEARADFAVAQERDAQRTEPLLGIALTHAAAGDVKEARRAYEIYLKAVPNDSEGWYNYGLVLLAANASDQAAAALRQSLQIAPQNADAHNALAVAALHTKDYPAAWKHLADAAQLAPADMDILINQILLQACLKDVSGKKHGKKK